MRALIVTLFIFSGVQARPELTATPRIAPSVAVPAATVAALLPVEKTALLTQFKKTLNDDDRVEEKQNRAALKEFSTAQNQELKDWRNQEKHARRSYFDAHLKGPDRKSYIQGYITRKEAFDQKQKNDLVQFKNALKDKHDHYKASQKNRDQKFKMAIDRNERPGESLWTK